MKIHEILLPKTFCIYLAFILVSALPCPQKLHSRLMNIAVSVITGSDIRYVKKVKKINHYYYY